MITLQNSLLGFFGAVGLGAVAGGISISLADDSPFPPWTATALIAGGFAFTAGIPHQEVVDRLTAAAVGLIETDTSEGNDTVAMESDCVKYGFVGSGGPRDG